MFHLGIFLTGLGMIGTVIDYLYLDVNLLIPFFFIIILAIGIMIGTYGYFYETKEERTARMKGYDQWNLGHTKRGRSIGSEEQMSDLEILGSRYAKGEISRDQYLTMKEELTDNKMVR